MSNSTADSPGASRNGAISRASLPVTTGTAVTGGSADGPRKRHRMAPSRALVSPPVPRDRVLKLAVIATAAGAFSGLFGVGGGTIIVPLLILWLGYGEREATGTSLAAIVIIAAYATLGQALYGNVDPPQAALVGVPALAGVVAGTALQQRLPERAVALLFAAFLVATAIDLIVA
jgi:uncharacterized membrane protein YfcA